MAKAKKESALAREARLRIERIKASWSPEKRAGYESMKRDFLITNPLSFEELAALYCERQECAPERLREMLLGVRNQFGPEGFVLMCCVDLSSSRMGQYVILPYGGSATLREVPDRPMSPRGLASDMSQVAGVMPAAALDVVDLTKVTWPALSGDPEIVAVKVYDPEEGV